MYEMYPYLFRAKIDAALIGKLAHLRAHMVIDGNEQIVTVVEVAQNRGHAQRPTKSYRTQKE